MNLFEEASRSKLRFNSPAGALAADDLWDLPLTSKVGKANLDDMARALYAELKTKEDNVSFVERPAATPATNTLQLKFDIVLRIIAVKQEENKAAANARERAEQKQRILELISRKQDQAMEAKSLDELQAALAAL